jgi:hypothetical protein
MPIATEKHYTVAQIAKLWGKSTDTVRRALQDVPGVLRIGSVGGKHKRRYVSLSVPESVLNSLHSRPLKSRDTKGDKKLPSGQGRRVKPRSPALTPLEIMKSISFRTRHSFEPVTRFRLAGQK